MKKRRKAQNKDGLHNLGSNDLLSRLPDDILVSILSSLPLKDAAVTNSLSRRWRYLWCKRDCLVFGRKCLKQHPFTLSVMEIKFLKTLILKRVDVNDKDLKKILSNCPVLEYLSIFRSRKLVKPEIHGKSIGLKNLDMIACLGLESVEICDSNIVSFCCISSPISLRFDNLQKLEKIRISTDGHSWKKINDMFRQISCGVPYLKVLALTFDVYHLQGAIELIPLIPKLPQLKQLTMKIVEYWGTYDLLAIPYLVEACPNLERLTIMHQKITDLEAEMTYREVRQMAKKPHQHLEVVEINEYYWRTNDLELAMYFFQNCVALKEFVIKTSKIPRNDIMECVIGAIYHTQQHLETITPVGVKLVILYN